jgi:hypothetical protein
MVDMKTTTLAAELNALVAAKPSTVASFAARRSARILELQGLLAAVQPEATPDHPTETLLRATRGGDKFGR